MLECLGFIGFGEVTISLISGMREAGYCGDTFVFQRNTDAASEKAQSFSSLTVCNSIEELLEKACNIIVAVPGASDKGVFEGIKKGSLAGHFFMDMSTALPDDKKAIEALVVAENGEYTDVAIMGSMPKLLQKTPMMISGRNADRMVELLSEYGFELNLCGKEVGLASMIKLCRSIFMKGLPALYLETKRTCEKYDVSEQVFSSIYKNMLDQDISQFLNRLLDGANKHTERQMAELHECIKIEENAGVVPWMTCSALHVFSSIYKEKKKNEPCI